MEGRNIRVRGANINPVEDQETGKPIAGNSGTIGIALVGDFGEVDEPDAPDSLTPEQLASANSLVEFLTTNLPNIGCIAGHGDINEGYELGASSEGSEFVTNIAEEHGLTLSGFECYEGP